MMYKNYQMTDAAVDTGVRTSTSLTDVDQDAPSTLLGVPHASEVVPWNEPAKEETGPSEQEVLDAQVPVVSAKVKELSESKTLVVFSLDQPLNGRLWTELLEQGYNVSTQDILHVVNGKRTQTHSVRVSLPGVSSDSDGNSDSISTRDLYSALAGLYAPRRSRGLTLSDLLLVW